MKDKTPAIGVRQAQNQPDLVIHQFNVPTAAVELCAFPELQAESLMVTEDQSMLSLGLSQLLDEAEGRYASARTSGFCRFGSLNFRPAGVPLEVRVSQGTYHTIRCRFHKGKLEALGIEPSALTEDQLEACFDIHAPRIEDAMMRLAEEVSSPSSHSADLVTALVTTIVVDLSRYLAESARRDAAHRGGLAPRHLRRVFQRLDEASPLPSIDEMAGLCGLSRYHFMRAFKQSVGESPGAYAQKVLMARARSLIASTERPLADIAEELGYNSAAAFSSAFRRHCGRSPRAWRACLR